MSKFENVPNQPKSPLLINTYQLLVNTHNVCNDFYALFDMIMIKKITEGITIADNYLDLFRAALLFSSSGLDSLVKQAVHDSLSTVIKNNEGSEERFRSYVEKLVQKNDQLSTKSLSRALISENPRNHFINCLISELTSRSLQSNDELLNVASYFDIPSKILVADIGLLKNTFNMRNQIAHEMDFDHKSNIRRHRTREELVNSINYIFLVSKTFLTEVDKRL